MAQGADKGGNLGDGPPGKGGNLGVAQAAVTHLEMNLKLASAAATKLKAKASTLSGAAKSDVNKLGAIRSALTDARRIKSALKGLQNKRKHA